MFREFCVFFVGITQKKEVTVAETEAILRQLDEEESAEADWREIDDECKSAIDSDDKAAEIAMRAESDCSQDELEDMCNSDDKSITESDCSQDKLEDMCNSDDESITESDCNDEGDESEEVIQD